ncbi:MAG: DUF4159 domain-containing protein [Phycisphaerales bacterium]|nr:DUF4159 domain-containing protein [Phycisphaerales bacterium]
MDDRTGRTSRLFLSLAFALVCSAARARAAPPTDADVDALVTRLVDHLKEAQVKEGSARGSFDGEMGGVHAGGVSALATFALLTAGVPWHDECIERAVDYLAEHPLPGTYSRSLRAGAWAILAQRTSDPSMRLRYRRLLQADADWLTSTIKSDGFHGYDAEGSGGDHSCSQFGVLGAWAAERASAEVSDEYWDKVMRHWLSYQSGDGSWSYADGAGGTGTMTTAGVNTMFVLLSQHLVRAEAPYVRLRGVSSRGRVVEDIDRVLSAAEHGRAWLSERDLLTGGPYQLFGLERLGVASGRKFIGAVDWYRAGVESVPPESGKVVDDAFRLLFLTYGRAPVLISKLQYGDGEEWNNYYRDLHFLTSYLSAQHERIYKWQVVSAESPLHDLLDAPILLISGSDKLPLTPEQRRRLRDYVDAGGTIIGHADRASERFSKGFRELVEMTFSDRGEPLSPLPANHPLYTAMHRDPSGKWATELRVEGAGNGLRTFAYLFPADVAGAWHQDLLLKQTDLFNLMINLRVCAAPEYAHLPKRLRPPELGGLPSPPRGHLVVACGHPSDDDLVVEGAWNALGKRLSHELGLSLIVVDRTGPAAGKLPADVIHLSGGGKFTLSEDDLAALASALRGGSLLWLEASGSRPAFIESAGALMKELASRLGGPIVDLPSDHPLLTGELPGGRAVGKMLPNRWGRQSLAGGTPRVPMVMCGDAPAAIFTPFDLLATGSGQFLYDAAAYEPVESAALLRNLILWKYDRICAAPGSVPFKEVVRDRPIDPLRSAAAGIVESGDWSPACAVVATLTRVDPEAGQTRTLREALRANLGRAMNQARDLGRMADAGRLALLLEEAFPGAFAALPDPAWTHGGAAPAAGSSGHKSAPRDYHLPAELSNIAIDTDQGPSDALTLLTQWFDVDAQRADVTRNLRAKLDDLKNLDAKAEELAARQGARGRSGERGGAEFGRIAEERKGVEAEVRGLRAKLAELEPLLDGITEALKPHEPRIASLGVRREKDRWSVGETAP